MNVYSHQSSPNQTPHLSTKIQPRPWHDLQADPAQAVEQSKVAIADFSHVDLFSHTPVRSPIQAKVNMGKPNAPCEPEAEQVAEQSRSMTPPSTPNLQRQDLSVQRQEAPEENLQAQFIQQRGDETASEATSPDLESAIYDARRIRHPLEAGFLVQQNIAEFHAPLQKAESEIVRRGATKDTEEGLLTTSIQLKYPSEEISSNTESNPAEVKTLIVDDAAKSLTKGQMKKSEFLSQLYNELMAVGKEEYAGTNLTAEGCPYIVYWFDRYQKETSMQVERAVRNYISDQGTVEDTEELIKSVCDRVRRGYQEQVRTGLITELPAGVPTRLGGMATGLESESAATTVQDQSGTNTSEKPMIQRYLKKVEGEKQGRSVIQRREWALPEIGGVETPNTIQRGKCLKGGGGHGGGGHVIPNQANAQDLPVSYQQYATALDELEKGVNDELNYEASISNCAITTVAGLLRVKARDIFSEGDKVKGNVSFYFAAYARGEGSANVMQMNQIGMSGMKAKSNEVENQLNGIRQYIEKAMAKIDSEAGTTTKVGNWHCPEEKEQRLEKNADEAMESMSQYPEGTRFVVNGSKDYGGTHFVYAEITGGKLVFKDFQQDVVGKRNRESENLEDLETNELPGPFTSKHPITVNYPPPWDSDEGLSHDGEQEKIAQLNRVGNPTKKNVQKAQSVWYLPVMMTQ